MFIVIELQKVNDTQVANNIWAYTEQAVAEQKFHTVLSAAAVSTVPVHSAVMLDEMGRTIKGPEYYVHEVTPNE